MKRASAVAAVAAVTFVGYASAEAATPASHHVPAARRYVATVDQTSGLNGQGVPSRLGGRGTLHAVLRAAAHPRGNVVGSIELELQVTSTKYPSTVLEIGMIRLAHGVLAVQGVQTENAAAAPLAITGGTGTFVGRSGTVSVSDHGRVTVHVARP